MNTELQSAVNPFLKFLRDRFNAKIDFNNYFLAYSGGKDSHFLYWFIKEFLHDERIEIVGVNTGFDLKSYASGQAFTDEYTTVCELSWCKRSDDKCRFIDVEDRIYCVFFGNEMAYIVINPSEQFFDDLKNRKMKSQREALKEYKEGYMVKKDDC